MPLSALGDRPLFFCLMLLKCCAFLVSTLLALTSEPFVCSFVNNQKGRGNKHCKNSSRTRIASYWRLGRSIGRFLSVSVLEKLHSTMIKLLSPSLALSNSLLILQCLFCLFACLLFVHLFATLISI